MLNFTVFWLYSGLCFQVGNSLVETRVNDEFLQKMSVAALPKPIMVADVPAFNEEIADNYVQLP